MHPQLAHQRVEREDEAVARPFEGSPVVVLGAPDDPEGLLRRIDSSTGSDSSTTTAISR